MSKNKNSQDSVCPFSYVQATAFSAGLSVIPLWPASFGRVATIADGFDLFKVTKLKYRLLPGSTITVSQSAAYYPGVTDTTPASVNAISQNPTMTYLALRQTVPSGWAEVPKADLHGYQTWYKTIAGSTDAGDEAPGNIYIAGTGTETFVIEIHGEFHFRGSTDTGSTPQERLRRLQIRERERLLALLSAKDLETKKSC